MRIRQMIKVFLMLGVSTSMFSGCMWTSEHVKKTGELSTQISGLEQDKSKLQKQLGDKGKELEEMTKNRDGEVSKNKKLTSLSQKQQEQIKQLSEKMTELEESSKQCQSNLKLLAAKGGKRRQKLREAYLQIQKLKNIAKKRLQLFNKLKHSFKSMLAAGKLKISMVKGMLIVQLEEKILFDTNSSKVKKDGKAAITEMTVILKKMNRRWQVTGHTDTKGKPLYNWSLSTRRALAFLKVMLEAEMSPKNISAAGYGQYQPTTSNDTKENRALNRRTELILVPNLEELQLAQKPSPFWACQALASL